MRLARSVASTPPGVRRGKDFYAAKAARVQRTAKVILARTQREPAAPKPIVDEPMATLLFPDFEHPSDPVISAHGLGKQFGDKRLFADLSFQIARGQRIAIAGANGTGKTTLLRIMLSHVEPDEGTVAISASAQIGYFAQDSVDLVLDRSPVDLCAEASDDVTHVHTMLACMRVPQRQLRRPARELSAGERAKVAFARLMLAAPNVLVLDEPTNHLDIDAQEAIEEALTAYPGTLLLVSHDRALVDRVTTATIDLAGDSAPMRTPHMTAADAVDLYRLLTSGGAPLWLDGGWAVDALIGKQARQHADLDIVIEERHVARLRELLDAAGFDDVPRDDTRPWNFVLGDERGRQVDVHVVVFDEHGNGVYGPLENGDTYPAGCLDATGSIEGTPVRCLTPTQLVAFHTGYDFDEDDIADVLALHRHFGIPLPEEYTTAIRCRAQ